MKYMRIFSGITLLALLVVIQALPATGGEPECEWTFMFYMNADNDLEEYGDLDLDELTRATPQSGRSFMVLLDRAVKPAGLYKLEQGSLITLKEGFEPDMGDYNVLVEFVRDSVKYAPAKKYALIIWNHGRGWRRKGPAVITRGISFDDTSETHITTNQLNVAMSRIKDILGGNLDILAMDACNMQMVEVLFALYKQCDFVVASEEIVPMGGFPYDKVLDSLSVTMNPEEVSKAWVSSYLAYYSTSGEDVPPVTLSAVKCSEFGNVLDAIEGLAKASMTGDFSADFRNILVRVQRFHDRDSIDLLHLLRLLDENTDDIGMQTAISKLSAALSGCLVANGNTGGHIRRAAGIAAYFPISGLAYSPAYDTLDFTKAHRWDDLLKHYYRRVTVPEVAADVMNGKLESLKAFSTGLAVVDREAKRSLVSHLNFMDVHKHPDSSPSSELSELINKLR